MKNMQILASCLLFFLINSPFANAAAFLDASYDSTSQQITLVIAYEGQSGNHDFVLHWGECETVHGEKTITALLIDTQGDEIADRTFEQTVTFDLRGVSCKPAELTIRSGTNDHVTVRID